MQLTYRHDLAIVDQETEDRTLSSATLSTRNDVSLVTLPTGDIYVVNDVADMCLLSTSETLTVNHTAHRSLTPVSIVMFLLTKTKTSVNEKKTFS